MPFTFGSAGGAVITNSSGTVLTCDIGDGRAAVATTQGLNICQLCERNYAYLRANGLLAAAQNPANVKTLLTTYVHNNLQGAGR